MTEAEIAALTAWLADAGLRGEREDALIRGFGERFAAAGGALVAGRILVDTLHPLYEGRAFTWTRGVEDVAVFEYGDTSEGEGLDRWRETPFYALEAGGGSHLHLPIAAAIEQSSLFKELREYGCRHVLLLIDRFGAQGGIGRADCLYSVWATRADDGFAADEATALRRLSPMLALALKTASLARAAETLAKTYLGRDPGQRVLSGRIARGVAEEIKTVLWFSDLRDYTRISDAASPEHLIPMLNDYADAIVSAIHWQGGDVLKLIGDGVLAIFPAKDWRTACIAALTAAAKARKKFEMVNARRATENLPTTSFYLGLHIGHVFYGNIGSRERLDFTVIGPAVNEVSRIAAMCRSVDQQLLMSDAFVDGARHRRQDFLSVGRFALRGVGAPRELYTLDPAGWAPASAA